jgi:hypothetical protein
LKKTRFAWTCLILLSLLLASCRTPAPGTTAPTTISSDAVITAAVETANAMLTALVPPTQTPPPPTATTAPPPPTQTLAATAETGGPTATTGPGGGVDNAAYNGETIPDGTDYAPGATFLKTWEFKNVGTSTWTTGYKLVFVRDAQMGGPASVSLPYSVAPGQVVPVSVNMTAPTTVGTHRGYWRLANTSGTQFGVEVWVEIDVVAGGTTPGPTATTGTNTTPQPSATITPTTSVLGAVSIRVDNAAYTGTCPHTFTYTAQFTLNQAATITYKLEAGANQQGFTIQVPAAVTANLPAGTHSIAYYLEFTASMTGWARLQISAPEQKTSDTVNYSLVCASG